MGRRYYGIDVDLLSAARSPDLGRVTSEKTYLKYGMGWAQKHQEWDVWSTGRMSARGTKFGKISGGQLLWASGRSPCEIK